MKNIRGFIQLLIIILLLAVGSSFAYFTAVITGSETNTTITLSGGVMNIAYSSGPNINISDIFPREEAWATKTFTLTGNNTTTNIMDYEIFMVIQSTTFSAGALTYTLTSTNNNGSSINFTSHEDINNFTGNQKLGYGYFTGPTEGTKTHNYTLKIYFPETGTNQSIDQNKSIAMYIDVKSGVTDEDIPPYYVLATDNDFLQIDDALIFEYYDRDSEEYIEIYDTIYLYTGTDDYVIVPNTINGNQVTSTAYMFGVYRVFLEYDEVLDEEIYDVYESTPVKGVALNNPNIDSVYFMFSNEFESLELKYLKTKEMQNLAALFSTLTIPKLNLRHLNTSSATNMNNMFSGINVDSLYIENLNTNNVTNMQEMFNSFNWLNDKKIPLDISNFNTSNVTNMELMFNFAQISSLNLGNSDTSKVRHFSSIFSQIEIPNLVLNNFDVSSANVLHNLFTHSKINHLTLNLINTENVTNMGSMFSYLTADTLSFSAPNNPNLNYVSHMFMNTNIPSIDLSNFDTSNVIYMDSMFSSSEANSFNLLNFDTSNVINMERMFSGTKALTLDLSSFDTSKITTSTARRNMFQYSLATTGYARTVDDANKFNTSSYKPAGLTFVVKP